MALCISTAKTTKENKAPDLANDVSHESHLQVPAAGRPVWPVASTGPATVTNGDTGILAVAMRLIHDIDGKRVDNFVSILN